jgi:alpha-1,3-rhamnosyltransferase
MERTQADAPEARPPRIEIAIPSYNHARFVTETLRSTFGQSLLPARLLVIDDGSKDDSPRVIERALAGCPFPSELVVRPNRGLCATLNEAFTRTSGDYFAYLGSDDSWEPRFLETGLALLSADPAAVAAYGHAWIIDGDGKRIGCTSTSGPYLSGDLRIPLLGGNSVPKSPTVFYRRSALARCTWNEESRLEDYEMYLQLSRIGPFARTSDVVGSWRTHGNNASDDLDFMLASVLDAHGRIGPRLGVSAEDLERTRASHLFRAGGYYLEAGKRARALRLSLEGLRGAPSRGALARRLVKLGTPRRVWARLRSA